MMEGITCSKCNSVLKNATAFCPVCGQKLQLKKKPTSSFSKNKWLLGGTALIAVVGLGAAAAFVFSDDQPEKLAGEATKTAEKPTLESEETQPVLEEAVEDVPYEDFTGYWMPFDTYNITDYPMGNYGFYIGEDFTLYAEIPGEGWIAHIQEASIEGNTLTTWEENLDGMEVSSYLEWGTADYVEREQTENRYTLFHEDDRDRLVVHKSGVVLQRVSEEELAGTSIDGSDTYMYPLFAEHTADQLDYLLHMYKDLNEEAVRYSEHPIEEEDITIQLENYPYSLGELSEEQLLEEKQIIEGKRPHPETDVSQEDAVEHLLTGSFESTPSYDYIKNWDLGYHFDNEYVAEGALAAVTVGHGARTNWSSGPAYSEIENVTFSDHVYTVHYTDSTVSSDKVDRFYRISENILYAEDENGEFTIRYEQGTDWKDFQGLPSRE